MAIKSNIIMKTLLTTLLILFYVTCIQAQDSFNGNFDYFNNSHNYTKEGLFQPDITIETTILSNEYEDIQVYPNPFTDYFIVSDINNCYQLLIYDISGKQINYSMDGNKIYPENKSIIFIKINNKTTKLIKL